MSNRVLDIATQIMVMAIIISVILLFVGIGVLVFIHVCVVGRAFRRGFGGRGTWETGSDGSRASMSRDDVEKLPCFDYALREKGSCSSVDCAVCLESFRNGDRCRLLPMCRHSFHAQCVDAWLVKTPICRSSAGSGKQELDGIELGESNAVVDLVISLDQEYRVCRIRNILSL